MFQNSYFAKIGVFFLSLVTILLTTGCPEQETGWTCECKCDTTYKGPPGSAAPNQGKWDVAANWSNGVPDETKGACVPAGKRVILNTNTEAKCIKIEGNVIDDTQNGKSLKAKHDICIKSGGEVEFPRHVISENGTVFVEEGGKIVTRVAGVSGTKVTAKLDICIMGRCGRGPGKQGVAPPGKKGGEVRLVSNQGNIIIGKNGEVVGVEGGPWQGGERPKPPGNGGDVHLEAPNGKIKEDGKVKPGDPGKGGEDNVKAKKGEVTRKQKK